MGRKSVFTPETLALARKLREEDGKTFAEISNILGINVTSIKNMSAKENWSDGKAREKKEEAVKATATITKIKKDNREFNGKADDLLNQLKAIGIENVQNFGKLALEPLFLKSISLAMTTNNPKVVSEAIKDVLKLMESEAFALKETERKLTIMIPQVEEIYEEPPIVMSN